MCFRLFPVTSLSAQPVRFADLHVVLKFEPVEGKIANNNVISLTTINGRTSERYGGNNSSTLFLTHIHFM